MKAMLHDKNGVFLLRRNGKEFFSGNCAAEFVEKAMETVTDGNKVCMFLKLQFLEGKKKEENFLKNTHPKQYGCLQVV